VSSAVRQRRLGLLVLAAVLVLGLVAAAVNAAFGGGGDDEPPKTAAASIAPSNTLVFVDISTDGDREAVDRANALLGRFGGYEARRDSLLKRLSGGEQKVDVERDVSPWMGDEAALALTESGTATAGSLILIEVDDERKARQFLARNPRKPQRNEYKDEVVEQYGTVAVAFKDGWMLVGQDGTVQAALDRTNGRGRTLAQDATYKRVTGDLPDGRVATAYTSATGLQRLLIPQGDVIGGLAGFLNQPGMQGIGLSVEARDDGARVLVKTAFGKGGNRQRSFEPKLVGDVPEGALAYYGVQGVSGALGNLVGQAAGSAGTVLARLRDELKGEVALVIERDTPAPILTIMTATDDEARTTKTLRELQEPLAKLVTPQGGSTPKWGTEDLGDGVSARTLKLQTGGALAYAVFDDRLVVSTSTAGIRHVKDAGGSLEDAGTFEDVLGQRPDKVSSLGFLDFSQLLELGEQTGLNDSRAYLAAREDLKRIRAVGISSSGGGEESTAEILLSIP
jgi:hypothetical protein